MENPCKQIVSRGSATRQQSLAASLLDLARVLGGAGGPLVDASELRPATVTYAIVALQLRSRPGLAFRAMMEEWDLAAIVGGLYAASEITPRTPYPNRRRGAWNGRYTDN